MHSLAKELNDIIQKESPSVFSMLSGLGRELYWPKGILTQAAEAKQKAKLYNATIGIARESGAAMNMPSIMKQFSGLTPDDALNYAPSFGLPDFRKEWKRQIEEKNPSLKGKPLGMPVVTSGNTHGLSLVADMFADPGDVVLMPDKVWGNYNLCFTQRRGSTADKYPMFTDDLTAFNVKGFQAAVKAHSSAKKLIVLLNFPNNPTGYTVTSAEAEAIAQTLVAAAQGGQKVVAVYDDAYFGLFFEERGESPFVKAAARHPNLLAIKLDGATKEDYVWGFRVGFVTFSAANGTTALFEALEKKAGGSVRGTVSTSSTPAQSIVMKAMKSPDYAKEKEDKYNVMKARYQAVKKALANPAYATSWTPYPFNSGYFMCVQLKKLNAEAFRLALLDTQGIGIIATSPTDVRVAFSCLEVNQVEDCFARMHACAQQLQKDPKACDLSLYGPAFEE